MSIDRRSLLTAGAALTLLPAAARASRSRWG